MNFREGLYFDRWEGEGLICIYIDEGVDKETTATCIAYTILKFVVF